MVDRDPWASSPSFSEPIRDAPAVPPVLFWYQLTMTATAVLYGMLIPVGGVMAVMAEQLADEETGADEWRVIGLLIGMMTVPLTIAYALPWFLKPSKGAWIYGLVLMAFLMTSCCYWPACIPLIIYWVREDTRSYFGA